MVDMRKGRESKPVFQIKVKFQKSQRGNYIAKLRFNPGSSGVDRPFVLSDDYASILEELIEREPQYVRVEANKFLAPNQMFLPTRDGQRLENFVKDVLKQRNLYLVSREGKEYLTDYLPMKQS